MDSAPVTKLTDGPSWVYEIKFDGYRALDGANVVDGEIRRPR